MKRPDLTALRLRVPKRAPGRRVLVASGVVVALALGGLLDSSVDRKQPIEPVAEETVPAGTLSSAWYCAATPGRRANAAAGTVAIANTTAAPLSGTATFFTADRAPLDVPFGVAPNGRTVLRPGDVADAPYVGTLVQVDGGAAAVEHTIDDERGFAISPCTRNASDQWHFADGATASGATMALALLNPFLEDAIVDLRFATSEGPTAPNELQGVVVPARRLLTIDVGERLRRRDWIATSIVARSGRLVVDEVQFGAFNGAPGVSLTQGARSASPEWHFPEAVAAGQADRLSLYNPAEAEATVELTVRSNAGVSEVFPMHVAAGGRAAFELAEEERVPKEGRLSVTVRSLNDVPVVAHRLSTTLAPAQPPGSFMYVGAVRPARRWAVVAAVGSASEHFVTIANHGDRRATVKLLLTRASGGEPARRPEISIDPGRRTVVALHDPAVTAMVDPVVVLDATEPVVVGRSVERSAPVATATAALAVPLD